MTSKQRSFLKSLAMSTEAIFQIGKGRLTPEITNAVDEALEARELITHSEVVQVIGKKIILYRESKTKKKIELPK